MIDWKQKLSSRKFWAAVVGVAGAVMTLLNVNNLEAGHITAIISAAGVLIAYILGESAVDAARIKSAGSGSSAGSADSGANTISPVDAKADDSTTADKN